MIDWTSTSTRTAGILKTSALPLYLFLAIAIGGATRDTPVSLAILQAGGCFLLVWTLFDRQLKDLSGHARVPLYVASILVSYALVQLIPLPPDFWAMLPGRTEIVEAFRLRGVELPALPISMAPQNTLTAILHLIPPIAIFLLAAKLNWRDAVRYMTWVIPLIACCSVLLGFAQVFSPQFDELYFRNPTVRNQAMGIMQVVNHNATLVLTAFPFVALAARRLVERFDEGDPDYATSISVMLIFTILIAGIVSTGSVAGYILTAPTLLLSYFMVRKREEGIFFAIASALAVILIVPVISLVVTNPNLSVVAQTDLSDSPLGRVSIYKNTYAAIQDHFPWGSGLGSFDSVYPLYEDPAHITSAFIESAHNEYLQVALELGLPGLIAIALGVIWIGWRCVYVWITPGADGVLEKRCASIVCFVVLAHCVVDFPTRTQSIACVLAYCIGLLAATPRRKSIQNKQPDLGNSEGDYGFEFERAR